MAISRATMNEIRRGTDSNSAEYYNSNRTVDFIDTGDMSLNRIITGSIYKGFPSGKVTMIAGPSQSGKSLITAKAAANAILKNGYEKIFIFDSELGGISEMLIQFGVKPDQIEVIYLESLEDATVKIIKTLDAIIKFKENIKEKKKDDDNEDLKLAVSEKKKKKLEESEDEGKRECKVLFILDSLGALNSDKVCNDAIEKNKTTGDMGGQAKTTGNLLRAINSKVMKGNFPFYIISHVYSSMDQHSGKIAPIKGGEQVKYLPSISLQTSKLLEKNVERKSGEDQKVYYSANLIKFFTAKNRLVKGYLETTIYLNMTTGKFHPYFGLFPIAQKYGLITCPTKGFYSFKGSEAKLRMAEVLKNKSEWDRILPELDAMSIKELSYSSTSQDIEELDSEIEDLEEAAIASNAPSDVPSVSEVLTEA